VQDAQSAIANVMTQPLVNMNLIIKLHLCDGFTHTKYLKHGPTPARKLIPDNCWFSCIPPSWTVAHVSCEKGLGMHCRITVRKLANQLATQDTTSHHLEH